MIIIFCLYKILKAGTVLRNNTFGRVYTTVQLRVDAIIVYKSLSPPSLDY